MLWYNLKIFSFVVDMPTLSGLHTFTLLVVVAFKQCVLLETLIAKNIAGGCTALIHTVVDVHIRAS